MIHAVGLVVYFVHNLKKIQFVKSENNWIHTFHHATLHADKNYQDILITNYSFYKIIKRVYKQTISFTG